MINISIDKNLSKQILVLSIATITIAAYVVPWNLNTAESRPRPSEHDGLTERINTIQDKIDNTDNEAISDRLNEIKDRFSDRRGPGEK